MDMCTARTTMIARIISPSGGLRRLRSGSTGLADDGTAGRLSPKGATMPPHNGQNGHQSHQQYYMFCETSIWTMLPAAVRFQGIPAAVIVFTSQEKAEAYLAA